MKSDIIIFENCKEEEDYRWFMKTGDVCSEL